MRSLFACALAFALLGCSSSAAPGAPDLSAIRGTPATDDGGPPAEPTEAGVEDSGHAYPSSLPSVPTVTSLGGPLLSAPKIVPVFFASDDATTVSAVTDFVAKLGASTYWASAVTEYGVGPATAAPAVHLGASDAPAATVDDSAIQTWLAGKLQGADASFSAPDAQTAYVLFYPAGVTITDTGAAGCTDFVGYHSEITLDAAHGGTRVPYAVVPRCATVDGATGVDALTAVASHEIVEAATDPLPDIAPAYLQVDDGHFYWTQVLGGSEVGDLCARVAGALVPMDATPYVVQRIWSNSAAKAGHDPCVPAPAGQAYFNAAPQLAVVSTQVGGQTVQTDGVSIPVGATATIPLHLFSDAPTGAFTVTARPAEGWKGELTFDFTTSSGSDGEVLSMSVHVVSAGKYGREPFVVTSTLGGTQHTWIGLVTN